MVQKMYTRHGNTFSTTKPPPKLSCGSTNSFTIENHKETALDNDFWHSISDFWSHFSWTPWMSASWRLLPGSNTLGSLFFNFVKRKKIYQNSHPSGAIVTKIEISNLNLKLKSRMETSDRIPILRRIGDDLMRFNFQLSHWSGFIYSTWLRILNCK